jgi:hypothetical protein
MPESAVQAVAQAVARLQRILAEAPATLRDIDEAKAAERPHGLRRSRKEILGHLVDSAGNNHQRFVRAQLEVVSRFPPYAGDGFLGAQGYPERPWLEIVALWRALNQHLVHVAARIPGEKLGHVCTVSADEPSTLGDHVVDYVDHLEHHLAQILEPGE